MIILNGFRTGCSYAYDGAASLGRGLRRVGQITTACARQAARIANSILGRKAILSIRENVVEFALYYIGADAAAPYGSRAGRRIGESTAQLVCLGGSALGSFYVAKIAASKLDSLPPATRKLLQASIFLGTSCCLFALVSNPGIALGTAMGEILGEYIGYYSGGILLAYFGIKFCGSEEVLIQASHIVRTYPVKTLVSMAGTYYIDSQFPMLQNNYTQPVSDLILGSLIYNSLDLAEMTIKIQSGNFLDGVMVKQFHVPKACDAVTKSATRQAVGLSFDNLSCLALPERPSLYYPLIAEMIPGIREALQDYCEQHVDSEHASLEFLRNLTDKKASQMIMRGANLYFHMLEHHPEAFARGTSTAQFMKQGYRGLYAILSHSSVDRVRLSYEQFATHPMIALLQEFSGTSLPAFPTLPSCEMPEFISPDIADRLTDTLFDLIQQQEDALFGFSISRTQEKQKIRQFIDDHMENIIKCALLAAPGIPVPITDGEARNFYGHLMHILPRYYEGLLGIPATASLATVLAHQAKHSEFN
jgi:hypothetical protein